MLLTRMSCNGKNVKCLLKDQHNREHNETLLTEESELMKK